MPETRQVVFTHRELAEILVHSQGITEGFWGIYVKFGLQAANVGTSSEDLIPAAVLPVLEIGIQRFEKENRLTVNAAELRPSRTRRSRRQTGTN